MSAGSAAYEAASLNATRYSSEERDPAAPAMSVALVTGSLSRQAGGLFYSARIPANRMAALGWSPIVYGIRDEDWEASVTEWNVHRITAYDPIGPTRLGIAPKMIGDMKKAKHDLVHLRGLWAFPSYAAARIRQMGVPILISPEGMLDPWALTQSATKKRIALHLFEADNLENAKILHALSASEVAHIRNFGLRNPVAVIPNGVDIPSHTASVGRVTEPRIMLFLGRIHPKKGLAELIEAWAGTLAIAPGLRQAWRVHIAGWDDGGHEAKLRRRINQLGLNEVFAFLGGVYGEAKDRAFRDASAFILPSHGEGLPISALEAAAHGLPLFLTRQCNLPELFSDGAGFEITPEPAALARELAERLGADYALMAASGERARRIAAERFSWSSVLNQYLALYEWAVAGGSPPTGLDVR
jgi:poly(glycerol-phosphate) alpha-glucosyltransferase